MREVNNKTKDFWKKELIGGEGVVGRRLLEGVFKGGGEWLLGGCWGVVGGVVEGEGGCWGVVGGLLKEGC